ncbi:hydrogenase formation protein HypD [Prosthecochloris sp. HL-130-GSB]|uniref:hydrogenase formation protein HypD n=1 Tax=Prosthecochloris sp. HL-130-GSB TaxID=1974213 RepID=UPI000A1C1219|nr:hydrogenase formation protein HypD [Prosthecochloris sp. HL-130-GSB]ARM30564.1 hydrogenase formation protein HypD [Prosthecochloris sp. HL-130-GSB]MBO8093289.1 hydrogenase formation protein HypD [Prosthecochloris sp.]
MKFIDEYRDPHLVKELSGRIEQVVSRPWTIMEICGGQTHSIMRYGIDQLLPSSVHLVHGPGCPVCVTSLETLDRAHELAVRSGVIFTTFGDMLRVPGSRGDLFGARASGGDVRFVFSPLEALQIARDHPDREVVFLSVGFETTAPGNALAVRRAAQEGLHNFSVLCSHYLVPPAMRAILSDPDAVVQGFLAAGHVCTITGTTEYEDVVGEFGVPLVVAGFEPVDLLGAILRVVEMLESGKVCVDNAYRRVVAREGNPAAREMMNDVFEICDAAWRGIGTIPASGLRLREKYAAFDAVRKFNLAHISVRESDVCRSGDVMKGLLKPDQCPAFGTSCTPRSPLGAPMVSGEGACAAYFRYRGSDE